MARYIDADKTMEEIDRIGGHNLCEWETLGVKALIDRQPTADVAPKSEVAREIFTEIEKLIFVGGFTGEVSNLTILTTKDYEALKKKYGVTDTNVGNKYFTAEQVRAMPPEEVRKNYSAIMESMKKWGEQK